MADITGASSATTANASGSSHVISAPAGSSVGELMVMCTTMTGSQNPAVINDDPDWVLVTKYRSTASNTTWQAWYYRYKQAGDSSWTITHTAGRGGSSILSMSGTATEDPIDVFSTEDHPDNTGGIAAVTAPSVNPTVTTGTLLLGFGLRAALTGSGTLPWTWTTPVNATAHTAANTNTTSTGARNGGHAVFTFAVTDGTSTGPRVSTNNNTGDGVGVQIVVKDLVVTEPGPFKVHTGGGTLIDATLLGIHDGAGGFTPATFVGLTVTAVTFVDAFDGAGPSMGPDWINSTDPFTIAGGSLIASAGKTLARWVQDAPAGVMFSEATYEGGAGVGVAVAIGALTEGAGPHDASVGPCYFFRQTHGLNDPPVAIVRKEAGVVDNTPLVTGDVRLVAGDVIRLEYDDPDSTAAPELRAYVNGTLVLTHTPTTPITGQRGVGIWHYLATEDGTPLFSGWSGGTV